MKLYLRILEMTCGACLFGATTGVLAQAESPKPRTVEMTLQPAGQPDPAMKHRLLTALPNLEPGDAAQYYYRALGLLPAQSSETNWDGVSRLLGTNISALPASEAADALAPLKSALKETATAGTRETCHWDMPMKEGMGMLLPGLGNFRKLAQGLALQCRAQVASRQWDAALASLTAGFALGRNVGKGPTLVQSLVGISMSQLMLQQVEALVQQPGAPNLYWALSALPRPFVDIRAPMEWENQFLLLQFPQLRDIEKTALSPEAARLLLARVMSVWTSGPDAEPATPRAEDTLFLLAAYPRAKQALLEQGFSRETLDSFPVAQVALIRMMRVFQHHSQDLLKWFYVPYSQAFDNLRLQEKQWDPEKGGLSQKLDTLLIQMLLPALTKSYTKAAVLERNIDALRCVEAIRLHASLNGGKLPQSLKDIAVVPVPSDTVTGNDFVYKIENGKAVLEGVTTPGESAPTGLKYVITMTPGATN